jgi:hypothetical protein
MADNGYVGNAVADGQGDNRGWYGIAPSHR